MISFAPLKSQGAAPRTSKVGAFSSLQEPRVIVSTKKIVITSRPAPSEPQSVAPRLDPIPKKTATVAPPPCSPKSIYILASLVRHLQLSVLGVTLTYETKLDIRPLCDSAFADIKTKVSLDNIVDEVFSWVTAGWVPMRYPQWPGPKVFIQPREDYGDAV